MPVPDGCIGGSMRGLRLQRSPDGVPTTTVTLPSGAPRFVTLAGLTREPGVKGLGLLRNTLCLDSPQMACLSTSESAACVVIPQG